MAKAAAQAYGGIRTRIFRGGLAACLWLAGCASNTKLPTGDPSLPEIDVLQLKENSDEALKLSQENKLEIQSLQAKIMELDGRVSALGDEITNLPIAKLEELTQQLALVAEQLRNLEDRIAKGAAPRADNKKDPATFSPSALAPPGAKSAPGAASPKGAAGAAKTPAPGPGPRKPSATDAEAQLYKKAFDLYYAKDFPKAIETFEELLQKFPAGTYADNCFYWIGECQFAAGNFAKAMAAFRKVFTFQETEKADDAQLKLGYCFLRLGDRRQAAEEFKKVVSLYPESEYTERAKEELAKLE